MSLAYVLKTRALTSRSVKPSDVLHWMQEVLVGTPAEDMPLGKNSGVVVHLFYVLNIILAEWTGPRFELSAWEARVQDGVWPRMRVNYAQSTRCGSYSQSWRPARLDDVTAQDARRRLDELREDQRQAKEGLYRRDVARQLQKEITLQEQEVKRRKCILAERDARERALQAARLILADKCEAMKWNRFSLQLAHIFWAEFPGQGVEAAYKFIANFVRHVTGKNVPWKTVARFINRAQAIEETSSNARVSSLDLK